MNELKKEYEMQAEDEGSSRQVIKSIMQSEIIKINVMLCYGMVGMVCYVRCYSMYMVTTMSLTLPHIKLADCIIYRFLSIYKIG